MLKTAQNVLFLIITVILFGGVFNSVWAQPIQLVAQPVFPQEQAQRVYQPLADYLTSELNREVQLTVPRNFQQHWIDVKNNMGVDLVLEEAPLTDYRINYKNFVLLVRGNSSVSYSLAALDPAYTTRDDLAGLPVATMPAPSTGYLIMARWYNNPLSQARIVSSAVSWNDAIQQIWDDEVVAAIIPSNLAEQYPQFNILETSVLMPSLALSSSPELDPELRQQIAEAMLRLHQDESNTDVLIELNIESFVPAVANEYRGYAEWLRTISDSSAF